MTEPSAAAAPRRRCAFIGLGELGAHLATSLLSAGFPLWVHDRDRARADDLVARGAQWSDSPAQAARQAESVFTCLPSPAASEAVLRAMLERMRPGSCWVEMSTLGRDDILRLARLAAEHGVATLEAPVTGGVHLAGRGQITVLAGGETADFETHRAALAAMGGTLFHMGPLGSASVIKVITNMLAFIHLIADGEALMLARRAGLDLGQAWRAIAASSGNSFVHETEGQLILNGSYDIGFTMDLALKDLGFAMEFGRAHGVPLDLAAVAAQTFVRGRAAYGGQAQSTRIVALLEDLLDTDLRAGGFPDRLT